MNEMILSLIFLNLLDEPGRHATNDCFWFYIFCDYRSSRDNGSFTNCHPWQNCHIRSKPNLVLYVNRLEGHVATMIWIWIVVDCTECGVVSYKTIIANEDTSLVLELTTAIDEYTLTYMRVLATIGIERWKHAECLRYVNIPKLGEQLPEFIGRVVLIVNLHGDANSLLSHLVHEEVRIATVLDRIPCCYVISIFLYCHIYSKAITAARQGEELTPLVYVDDNKYYIELKCERGTCAVIAFE